MHSFFIKVIIKATRTFKDEDHGDYYSDYEIAKRYREFIRLSKRFFKNFILIVAGIFSASFGFKGFLLTNDFIDGGATGISLLLAALTVVPLYALIILVNLPFVILGYKIMGKSFAIKTAFAIA